MQLGTISKILMFLSSYALLFTALSAKYYGNALSWALLAISLVGVVATIFILKTRINPDTKRIVKVSSKNEKVLTYLATYLLPFLGFNSSEINDMIALFIVFFTIGILYIKADLIYINPFLMFIGYNIYEVEFENGITRILISKQSLNEFRLIKEISYYELQDRMIIIDRKI